MLDEIGQADPRDVGELVYMIFNEAGRMRGTARLSNRSLPRWQLLLLSSGEKSLQQMMQDAGKVPMAGQELRLLHIPVDSGDGCGILNGLTDGAARTDLIRAVDTAVAKNHGVPIQEFLTRLTHPENLAQTADAAVKVKALTQTLTDGIASDEVKRAALRFALVGVGMGHYRLAGRPCRECGDNDF
jgi:putative DNA primase/helicase